MRLRPFVANWDRCAIWGERESMEICKDVRKKVGRKFIQIVIVFVAAALTAYVLMRDIDKQSVQPLQNYSGLCTFMHIAVRNSIVFFLLSNILISEKRIARMTAWLFVLINGISESIEACG